MRDNELLREMIREVIEEDWKSKLAGAALAVCTAAGCAPVKDQAGRPATPDDYGITSRDYDAPPGSTEMDWEEEDERETPQDPPPTKLTHPGMKAGTMGR